MTLRKTVGRILSRAFFLEDENPGAPIVMIIAYGMLVGSIIFIVTGWWP